VSGAAIPGDDDRLGTFSNRRLRLEPRRPPAKDVLCHGGPMLEPGPNWCRCSWTAGTTRATKRSQRAVSPMAESVLAYFDTRFKKGPDGKIVLSPTQAWKRTGPAW